MKKLLLSFALVVAFLSTLKAQILPVDAKTGKVTYIEVVDAAGMTAKDLFKAAKDWGVAKGLEVKKEDEATGEIVFAGKMPVDYTGMKGKAEKGIINYSFSIFIKDGKYRFIATDFIHEGVGSDPSGGKLEAVSPVCGPGRMSSSTWLMIKKRTSSGMDAIVADLKRVIKEIQNDPAKKTDW